MDTRKAGEFLGPELLKRLAAQAGLTDTERACVALHYELASVPKIARRLELSEIEVRAHLDRAERLLRETARALAAAREGGHSALDDLLELMSGPRHPNPPTPLFSEREYSGAIERVHLHCRIL